MKNIPNLLTVGRLLAVPVVVWLILIGRLDLAFWLFIAAGFSDALDGFLARRLHATSAFGEMLDPVADKLLMVSIYITLGLLALLPTWLVIVVVSRDILIVSIFLGYSAFGAVAEISPLRISKFNTAAQITLAAVVLGQLGLSIDLAVLVEWLIYLVAVTTVLSGTSYLVRLMRGTENSQDPAP